ncbi:MAG: outer membrane lipoprotein carrier protein LolA [Pseudomonadota bacterium]
MRLLLFIVILLAAPVFAADNSPKAYILKDSDKVIIAKIENYLSGVNTISAEFIQAAPSGDISTGKFYLKRPGKLRMEYAPPVPVLMITSGSNIVYYDKELDQVSRISLEDTLVGFLARSQVKFDDGVIITGIEHNDHIIRVSLIQSKTPKDGSLTLEFADNPMILHNMIVTDKSGQITTVSLNNARFNTELEEKLFVFVDPHLGKDRSIKH